jgi:hypothetical protein
LEPVPVKPKVVMATVYLKSQSGRSLLQEQKAAPIDSRPYLPSSETISRAISELQRLGFKIEAQGVTLSISGPSDLFEQTCGVKISVEERIVHEFGKAEPTKQLMYKSSQTIMHIPGTDEIIDGIMLSIPAIYFEGYKP